MAETDTPWEPPLSGSELEQLGGALERLRATFRFKADGLGREGLSARTAASTLTLGGLLKHLAVVEDNTFQAKLSGVELGDPWSENGWDQDPDWEMNSAAEDSPERLYSLWAAAVSRSRQSLRSALQRGGLDQAVDGHDHEGHHASLRRLVLDLIEEYGRHAGHADLLREAVDGRVGEDPPSGWRPALGDPSIIDPPPIGERPGAPRSQA